MSDKFRTTFPIAVSLADGEQPTAKKINAISTQSKNGLALIEKAIGDLWNQSGDSITSSHPNKILNLSRNLGNQSLISSSMVSPRTDGVTSIEITQAVVRGSTEISLDFIPISDATLTASVQALHGLSVAFAGSSVARAALTGDTAWCFDSTTNKIYLGSAVHATNGVEKISYNVLVANIPTDVGDNGFFNLIPHQDQLDWIGIKIVKIAEGKYFLTLPFRRPLSEMPDKAPSTSFINEALQGSPSTIRYYGPDPKYTPTAGIVDEGFYRYTLPDIVYDMFDTPVAGQTIPAGSLLLWDNTNQTIVEGVTFKVPEAPMTMFGTQVPWVIQADGVSLDNLFSSYVSSDVSIAQDTEASYAGRFSIICAGNSVADNIKLLKDELMSGSKTVGIQKKITHSDITITQPLVSARHLFGLPTSFVDGDEHSHYLSRLGSQLSATTSAHRDRFNNGIMGDLLVLNQNSTSNHQNLTGDSFSVYFGSHSATSPKIYSTPNALLPGNLTTNGLVIDNAALLLFKGTLGMADAKISCIDNHNFAFFNDSEDADGTLWPLRVVFNGSNSTMSAFTAALNTSRYVDINATTTNSITFKGGNLLLDAVAADGSVVAVGTNTHLRLVNNTLQFGTATETLSYASGTDTFTFTGNVDIKSTTGEANAVLVPHLFKPVATDAAWNQLSALPGNTRQGPLITFPTIPTSNTNDIYYFPITGVPPGATITEVKIKGYQYNTDCNSLVFFRCGIADSTSVGSSNIANSNALITQAGLGVETTYTVTLATSGYTVSTTVDNMHPYLALGFLNSNGSTRTLSFLMTGCYVKYTYTKIRL